MPGVPCSTMNIPLLTHHDEDVGDLAVAAEPLLAVDDPLVAVALGGGLEQRRVGTALRLGHRERRPDLLGDQRLEVPLLLFRGAVGGEDLHVAGVGCLRAEDRRRRTVRAEDLVQERELELTEAGAAEILVEEERPEALLLDLVLERIDDGRRCWGSFDFAASGKSEVDGVDLLAAELLDPVEFLLEFRFGREVPAHL